MKAARVFYLDDQTYLMLRKLHNLYRVRYGEASWDQFFRWLDDVADHALSSLRGEPSIAETSPVKGRATWKSSPVPTT